MGRGECQGVRKRAEDRAWVDTTCSGLGRVRSSLTRQPPQISGPGNRLFSCEASHWALRGKFPRKPSLLPPGKTRAGPDDGPRGLCLPCSRWH